jgi:hypothetical protein
MSSAVPGRTSLENCIKRYDRKNCSFSQRTTFKSLLDHMEFLIVYQSLGPEKLQAHFFGYILRGRDLVKKQAADIGLPAISGASDEDILTLKDRIQVNDWDMQNLQDILFSTPLDFTYVQAFDLAGVIIERKKRDDAERMTAFMMLAHPRLGELNALSILDPDTLHSMVEKSLV